MSEEGPYSLLYKQYGVQAESLGWSSKSQEVRFERLLKAYNFRQARVLDIGCGFSDFLSFMIARKQNPQSYVGIEPFDPFFQAATERVSKLKNLDYKVVQFRWEEFKFIQSFDVMVAIGLFNFREHGYQTLFKFIDFFVGGNCNTLIVSVLSDRAPEQIKFKNNDKFFYAPEEISRLSTARDLNFQLIQDYLPHDLMLKVDK